jgi:hypothetical protein
VRLFQQLLLCIVGLQDSLLGSYRFNWQARNVGSRTHCTLVNIQRLSSAARRSSSTKPELRASSFSTLIQVLFLFPQTASPLPLRTLNPVKDTPSSTQYG